MMNGPNKVTAPIARSTAYDFNCHLSLDHTSDPRSARRSGHEPLGEANGPGAEVLDVMPHEFLFEDTSSRGKSASRMKAKSSLNGVVLSSQAIADVNYALGALGEKCKIDTTVGRDEIRRLDKPMNPDVHRSINRALNRHIQYIGVAVTGIKGGPSTAQQRQGFSATRGGLFTIVHRGDQVIPAGARIAMQFDIRDIVADRKTAFKTDGIPYNKILPRLIQVEDRDEAVYDLAAYGSTSRISVHVKPAKFFLPDIDTLQRHGRRYAPQ
jgi:hypothetical protein